MSAATADFLAIIFFRVDAFPTDVVGVRARILFVTRFRVCVAGVLDAADAAVYFSIKSECCCWNHLRRCGSRHVESRIEPALYRDI